MGTWGHGNFDDDTSADDLGSLMARLVKEVSRGEPELGRRLRPVAT